MRPAPPSRRAPPPCSRAPGRGSRPGHRPIAALSVAVAFVSATGEVGQGLRAILAASALAPAPPGPRRRSRFAHRPATRRASPSLPTRIARTCATARTTRPAVRVHVLGFRASRSQSAGATINAGGFARGHDRHRPRAPAGKSASSSTPFPGRSRARSVPRRDTIPIGRRVVFLATARTSRPAMPACASSNARPIISAISVARRLPEPREADDRKSHSDPAAALARCTRTASSRFT